MNLFDFICSAELTFVDSLVIFVLCVLFILAVLAFLMAILYLMPVALKIKLLKLLKLKKRTHELVEESDSCAEPMLEEPLEQDEEMVAAITAAIVALRDGENTQAPFVIKKIKRK